MGAIRPPASPCKQNLALLQWCTPVARSRSPTLCISLYITTHAHRPLPIQPMYLKLGSTNISRYRHTYTHTYTYILTYTHTLHTHCTHTHTHTHTHTSYARDTHSWYVFKHTQYIRVGPGPNAVHQLGAAGHPAACSGRPGPDTVGLMTWQSRSFLSDPNPEVVFLLNGAG